MKQGKQKKNAITVVNRAPGKKGKLEYRTFDTFEQVQAYFDRNTSPREHGKKGRIA